MTSKLLNVDENNLYKVTRLFCGRPIIDVFYVHSKMIHIDCISYFASYADGRGNQFIHEYVDTNIDGNVVAFEQLVEHDKREIIIDTVE